MRSYRSLGVALAVLGLVAAGCSGDDESSSGPPERRLPDLELAASLTPFESCDSLLAWIKGEATSRVTAYGLGGGPVYATRGGVTEDFAADGAEGAGGDDAASAPTVQPTGGDFSGTNVQVEGVDEPDIVKTDGRRVLAVANGELQLIDASAETPVLLDSLALDNGWGSQLLLSGDRALVLGQGSFGVPIPLAEEGIARDARIAPELSGSTITEVDLSGDTLRKVDEITIEGAYLSARMIGDVVRVVVHADPQQRLAFVYPTGSSAASEERAEAVNSDVVDDSTIDDWLPHWSRDGEDQGLVVGCEGTHRPQTFSGFGVLSVLTVDLSEGLAAGLDPANGTAVLAGGQTVYASPSHLYVATNEYVEWESLSEDELRTVDRDYGTAIHRFDISDPDRAVYEVSGRVDGSLLNQFSMDEHGDVLRVATTEGSPWFSEDGETSESQVVTLGERDGALVQLGAVGGLGKGETIHSVRFIGDTGYVVTFRQTDPLYTIDLSDPAAPRVAGELKILGYSAYLHPIADGYLIGVGQDATEEGRVLGTQVALFDVRDPAAPTRVAVATIPNGSSGAEWDHHAFLWWPETALAVIPVSSYDQGSSVEAAVGFTIDTEAGTVTELGRISHPERSDGGVVIDEPVPVEPDGGIGDSGTTESGAGVDAVEPSSPPVSDVYTWTPPITRSFVIGGRLFTLSDFGLMASELATLAPGPYLAF